MVEWGELLGTALEKGVPAVFSYLTARESNRTAAEIAKYQARQGGGLGLDTIMGLVTLGQTMGGYPGPSQPVPQLMPQPYFPGTSALTMPSAPTTPQYYQAPYIQQQSLAAPTTTGGVVPALATTIPQQQAGWGDIVPYIGEQVYSWMTNGGGATVPSGGVGELMNLPQVYTPTAQGARAKSRVITVNPVTGSLTYYKNMGKPILYSGDLAACKRVRKIAARARRASPRPRTTTKRRR